MNRTTATTSDEKVGSGSLDRILSAAGLDFHVLVTLLLRSWSILAGGVTAFAIPSYLTSSQQGYFYTFTAVLATQIFFELGLNHVLIQLASHSAAHLRRVSENKFEGDLRWRYAILSLLTLSGRWAAIMASLFFVGLLFGGVWFFYEKGSLPTSQWLAPWAALIASTAVNLALSSRLAICEGIGEVGQIARLRLLQSIAGYSALWLLLISNAGLWAAISAPICNAIGTIWWLWRRRLVKSLDIQTKYPCNKLAYTYCKDIFPLQWRIALSWISGYFIFHFLTPIIFANHGAVAAGKLGLALTIFSAFSTVGYSWISAKVPSFGSHVARNERSELNALFDKQALCGITITTFFSFCFLVTLHLFGDLLPRVVDRLPSMHVLHLISLSTIANTAIFSMAVYVRAHKEEPMMTVSMLTATLIGIGVWWASRFGVTAAVASYTAVNVLVTLPWSAVIFARYRKRTK